MAKSLVDSHELEALAAPVCAEHGVELVDVRLQPEPGGAVLRVLIERLDRGAGVPDGQDRHPGGGASAESGAGVSLDDCTNVSRGLSRLLDDREDLIPGQYRLEVSSPGIERPLVKPRDYERFAGREVKLATKAYVSERKNFSGKLVGLRGDQTVVLADEHGTEIEIPFAEIQKAHLVYRF
jgi:ribosome maturation factor RimP